MANGRFLLWLKNVLKVNTIPGYMADFDKTRADSVFYDNYNRIMEVNNLQEGLIQTQYHGLKASVLDGSSQYWQLALPAEQITNSTFETNVLNWTAEGTLTQDAELGKQGNYCAKWVYATNQTLTPALTIATTVGQKYKVKLYYKSNANISFQSGTTTVRTLVATSEWNYVSFIFTAVSTTVRLLGTASGIGFFDNVSMVLDQGLDANQDQERILHIKNAESERTLGAELSTNSGATGLTDWVDSNADGLANDWANSGFATSENEFTEMLATGGFSTFNKSGNDITLAICDAPSNYARTGQVTDMVLAAGTYRITFTLTVNSGSGTFRWRLSTSSSLSSAVAGGEQTYSTTGTHTYDVVISTPGTYFWGLTSTGTGLLNFALTNVSIALIAEVNSIVTNGWTGNAQKVANVSGGLSSLKHSAGTYAAGTKCIISGEYKSSHEFGIYKNATDYYGTLLPASSSPKPFEFEVLLTDAVWFFGTKNAAPTWLEVDKVSVKPIPNLITNGTFTGGGTNWSREEPATQTFADGVCHFINTTAHYSIFPSNAINSVLKNGKRYRVSLQILNYLSGGLRIGGTGIVSSPTFASNAVHPYDFTYTGTNGLIYLSATVNNTTLDIDNIHIYEIPEWTASGNHACDISILDKSSGTQSFKVTASGAGRGAEFLNDPNFNDTAQWSKLNATVAGGKGIIDNQGGILSDGYLVSHDVTLTVGKKYEVEINIDSVTLGNALSLKFYDSANGNFTVANIVSAGRYRTQFTCVSPICRLVCRVSPTGSTGVNYSVYAIVDSMSFKEVLGEITLPAVNIEPLVAGKKYTIQGQARLDPASLVYGSNLASGWNFTNWTPQSGVTINDLDTFTTTGTSSGIYKAFCIVGKVYKLIVNSTSSTYNIVIHNGTSAGTRQTLTSALPKGASTTYYFIATFPEIMIQSANTDTVDVTTFELYQADMVTITHQIGTKSVNAGGLSIVPGSFTKFVLNFEATNSEVNADWKSYLDGVGAVFVDSLSLTQRFDWLVSTKFKPTRTTISENVSLLYFGSFFQLRLSNASNLIELYESVDGAATRSSGATMSTTNYNNIIMLLGNTTLSWFADGVTKNTFDISMEGKIIHSFSLVIGSTGTTRWLQGLLSHLQIIRFDNISKTNFNPNTYQSGDAITDNGGGVPEVVLWQDWSNVVGAIAMDKYRPETTRRNNLTAYGSPLASTNIVTVEDYSPQTKKLRQGTQSKQPIYNSVTGFDFDGTNDILEARDSLGAIKTIVLKLKADNIELGQDILQLSAGAKLVLNVDGTITATGFTSPTIKIQNTLLADAVITANNDFLVCVKTATAITADAFKLGGSTTFFNGKIRRIALFTTELDDPTIQKIFKSIRSI